MVANGRTACGDNDIRLCSQARQAGLKSRQIIRENATVNNVARHI